MYLCYWREVGIARRRGEGEAEVILVNAPHPSSLKGPRERGVEVRDREIKVNQEYKLASH